MRNLEDSIFKNYIDLLEKKIPFSFLKINHGFWDKLAPIDLITSWPHSLEEAAVFAKSHNLPSDMMSDYVNEFMHLLELHRRGISNVDIFASVSAVPPNKENIKETSPNAHLIEKYLNQKSNPSIATLMKHLCETGQIIDLLAVISKRRIVVVAPYLITRNFILEKFENISYVDISFHFASIQRWQVLEEIERELLGHEDPILIIQAGTLSVYWGLILKSRIPDLTVLDMGMALGVFAPDSLSSVPMPWTSNRSEQIFESARKIGLTFSCKAEIDVSYYSAVSKLSWEVRQLTLLDSGTADFSWKIKQLEAKLICLEVTDLGLIAVGSSIKYWLSEAYLKAGEKERAFELLEETLSLNLQGFHLPYIAKVRNSMNEKKFDIALSFLENSQKMFPKEWHFVQLGERLGRLTGSPEIVKEIENWRRDHFEVSKNPVFADLPFWKSEDKIASTKLLERIQNHVFKE